MRRGHRQGPGSWLALRSVGGDDEGTRGQRGGAEEGRPAPLAALTFPARSRAAAADSRVNNKGPAAAARLRAGGGGGGGGDSRAVKQRSKLGGPRFKRLGRAEGWGGAPSCLPHYVGSPGAGVRAGELAAVSEVPCD